MSSSNPTSVEEGKETLNSDPSGVSNDRSSAEKMKGKKRSREPRLQPKLRARSTASLSTSPNQPKVHLRRHHRLRRDGRKVPSRTSKKDKLAPHESSSEEENCGGTVGLNYHDSDPDGFDNNVNPEDDKFTLGDGRSVGEKRT